MADYQLTETDDVILRMSDRAAIPREPEGNADWQTYQDWLDAGGVPDPARFPVVPTLNSVGGDNTKTAAQILGAT